MGKHHTSSLIYFLFFLKILSQLALFSLLPAYDLSLFVSFPPYQFFHISLGFFSTPAPLSLYYPFWYYPPFLLFHALFAPSLIWLQARHEYSVNICIAYHNSRPIQFFLAILLHFWHIKLFCYPKPHCHVIYRYLNF